MRKSKIKAGDDLTDGLDVAIFVTEIMLLMGKNTSGRRAMTLQVGKKGRLYRWNMCSLARSVPKPLKVPSLARSVPKPLRVRSVPVLCQSL